MDDEEKEQFLNSEDAPTKTPIIDWYMFPSKICFLLQDGIFGMFWAYLVVFFTSAGLDIKEAGFISGIRFLTATLTTPLWGFVSDYTGCRKLIFVILCLGTALTVFPLPWVANAFRDITCNITTIQDHTQLSHECNTKLFSSRLFYAMLILICISSMFSNPIHGLTDSFVMNTIKSSERETDYGKQRVFGGIGFGLTNFIVGLSIDNFGKFTIFDYSPVFDMVLVLIILLIPAGLITASQSTWETPEQISENKGNKQMHLSDFFCKLENNIFVTSVIIAGVSNSVVNCYLFQMMSDEMNAPKTMMGLANLVAGMGEIVIFPLSGKLMKLFKGPINCITVAISCYVLRCILFAFIRNPWLVMPTQFLNGICFGLFWVATAEHTQTIAAKEIYITTFSIVSNSYFNIGGMCGTLFGGLVYSAFGGSVLYLGISCLCGFWVILLLLFNNIRIQSYIFR